jgi:type I restriction-modification system DNA methylase subunit
MFEQTFKNIDDVLRKEAGCATELDYAEQISWLLFLKYLDDLEVKRQQTAQASFQASERSWFLDLKDVDQETLDLSVKNPRAPQEILAEIAQLDQDSAGLLQEVGAFL